MMGRSEFSTPAEKMSYLLQDEITKYDILISQHSRLSSPRIAGQCKSSYELESKSDILTMMTGGDKSDM